MDLFEGLGAARISSAIPRSEPPDRARALNMVFWREQETISGIHSKDSEPPQR